MKKALAIIFLISLLSIPLTAAARQQQLIQKHLFTDANLVSYWPLSNTTDYKGSNTLNNNGTITFVPGLFGNAANFVAASSQYFTTGGAVVASGNFTISAWVNFTTTPSSGGLQMIASQGITTEQAWWLGLQNVGGTLGIYANVHLSGGTEVNVSYNTTPTTGTWYHVALVYDGSNVIIYWNGVSVATQPYSSGYRSSTNFWLGSYVTTALFLNGKEDDVSVFNRALTPTEIAHIYTFRSLEGNGISR